MVQSPASAWRVHTMQIVHLFQFLALSSCKKLKNFIIPFLSKIEICLYWAKKCPNLTHLGPIRIFLKNRALSFSSIYNFLSSSQISEIFIVLLLRTFFSNGAIFQLDIFCVSGVLMLTLQNVLSTALLYTCIVLAVDSFICRHLYKHNNTSSSKVLSGSSSGWGFYTTSSQSSPGSTMSRSLSIHDR